MRKYILICIHYNRKLNSFYNVNCNFLLYLNQGEDRGTGSMWAEVWDIAFNRIRPLHVVKRGTDYSTRGNKYGGPKIILHESIFYEWEIENHVNNTYF